MTRRATLLIADDHPIVAEGVAASLERWYRVAGIVTTLVDLPNAIRTHSPAVTVLDLSFAGESSLRMLPRLVRDFPTTRFLILTAHDDEVLADKALQAGARGFVIKRSAPTELRVAIEEILEDRVYVTPMVRDAPAREGLVPRELAEPDQISLSERQVQILLHLRDGLSYRDIAERMELSTKTVEYHINLLRVKTGLSKTSQLIRWAETVPDSGIAPRGAQAPPTDDAR